MQRLEVAGPRLERLGTPHGACSSTPHQDPYRTLSRACAPRAGAWLIASHCHTLRRGRPHLATSDANRFEASLAPAPACLLQPLLPHHDRRRLALVVYGATTTLCCDDTLVFPLQKRVTRIHAPLRWTRGRRRRSRSDANAARTLHSIGGRWSAAAQCLVRAVGLRAQCAPRLVLMLAAAAWA